MQTETRKLSELKPDPQNARTHDERNLEAITESLTRFGQRKPIVITPEGVILAGNGTYTAAHKLGWDTIEVAVTPADWDYATARAYALADNRSAELAAWEPRILADQLVELDSEGWDITALGFDLPTTEQPTPEDEGPLTFDDEATPTTKVGDIYQLGNHRLMCGDSTDLSSVLKLMNGNQADMVYTDPPYGVNYDGGHATKKRRDKLQNDDAINMYNQPIKNAYQASKDEAPLYLWFADRFADDVITGLVDAGYTVRNWIIWNKNVAQFGAIGAQYKAKHEPCIYAFKKGKTPNWIGPTNEVTVWDVSRDNKNEHHPTQKPVELAKRAMKNHSVKEVLDLFGGSGSTLIAAEQTNRIAYLMELDPKYCDVIVKRWEQYTGQKAQLIND